MPPSSIDTLASVFTAVGTVAVAILAIWGDQVRDFILGPRLSLSLLSASGDLTKRLDGTKVYYYHLRVKNRRRHSPAKCVRVVVQGISKRAPNVAFVAHPLVYPLQLVWTPQEPGEVERTVVHGSTCDFGFLNATAESEQRFNLAVPSVPNNFRGFVKTDQCVRFEVVAVGKNVFSLEPTIFEVSWNGRWTENQEEMKQHLIIRAVSSLSA